MNLYSGLTRKQRRSIERDINTIFSNKGFSFPKTIDELKEIGFLSPRVKVDTKEIYLSKDGNIALGRICDIVYQSNGLKSFLSYDNVFRGVLDEIERWINQKLVPNTEEFIDPLEKVLLSSVCVHFYACKVDGLELEGVELVDIGLKTLRPFKLSDIESLSSTNNELKDLIGEEYQKSLIIIGSECGSSSVSIEKFYHNAELSLSVLRLYSCVLFDRAIYHINIRLINDSSHAFGVASCFGWKEHDNGLLYTKHIRNTQDFVIDAEVLAYLRRDLFFDKAASLVEKSEKNEIESALVKAIYWVGEAQKDKSSASAWIKLWSALECFFTLGGEEITERNSRGITSLIILGGVRHEKYSDYESLKSKIKKFYAVRSKIVHHAEYQHVDNIMLEEMAYITAWVIITIVSLIVRGYTTLAQINEQAHRLDKIQI